MAHKFILRDFTNIKTPTRLFDIVDNYEQNYPSQNIALAGKQTGQWEYYSPREYQEYMNSEKDSFAFDKQLILDVIDNHIAEDEVLFDYYADKSLGYNSDYQLGLFLLWKFINEMDERFDADPPAFKTEHDDTNDDKTFLVKLFKETLKHADEYQELVKANISNWDYDRIALMDKIIIFMALTEFCQFRDIPVKVTINEYIEISKYYSTPDSRRFVNGILDKLAEQLTAEGKLVKSGRGLV